MCKNTILLTCLLSISTAILSIDQYAVRAQKLFNESGASTALRDSSTWVPTGVYMVIQSMNGRGSKSLRAAGLMWLSCFGANMAKYAFPRTHAQLKREAPSYMGQFVECPAAAIMLLYNGYKFFAPEKMSRLPYLAASSIALTGSYYYSQNPDSRFIAPEWE